MSLVVKKNIRNLIQKISQDRKINLSKLAKLLEVPYMQLYFINKGKQKTIPLELYLKIYKLAGENIEEFFNELRDIYFSIDVTKKELEEKITVNPKRSKKDKIKTVEEKTEEHVDENELDLSQVQKEFNFHDDDEDYDDDEYDYDEEEYDDEFRDEEETVLS
jgi:DNA-binding Xre family transcriptional regulator